MSTEPLKVGDLVVFIEIDPPHVSKCASIPVPRPGAIGKIEHIFEKDQLASIHHYEYVSSKIRKTGSMRPLAGLCATSDEKHILEWRLCEMEERIRYLEDLN